MNISQEHLFKFAQKYLELEDHREAARSIGIHPNVADVAGRELLRRESTWFFIDQVKINAEYSKFKVLYDADVTPLYDNIFYCCTQKTASQWLKRIFVDPIFYNATGLKVLPYASFGNKFAEFHSAPPQHHLIAHMYIGYETYEALPKDDLKFKTFYITRDPRDALVSWYNSARYSHVPLEPIDKIREVLVNLSVDEGMMRLTNMLGELGVWDCQLSWHLNETDQGDFKIFRFEDLSIEPQDFLSNLFNHLDVGISVADVGKLCKRHSFKQLPNGRSQGQMDVTSHYRSGIVGEWKSLPIKVLDYFNAGTDNLAEKTGYSS